MHTSELNKKQCLQRYLKALKLSYSTKKEYETSHYKVSRGGRKVKSNGSQRKRR